MRDIRKALEVNMQRISRSSGNDQLGLMFLGKTLDFVIVNSLGVIANAVTHNVEITAGKVQMHAVSQVTAIGQTHSHHGIARIQKSEKNSFVGLSAGVRLDIDGHLNACRLAKELLGAFNGNTLHLVNILAAAIIALSRITFGVLVRQK